jgi:hypothetical protein
MDADLFDTASRRAGKKQGGAAGIARGSRILDKHFAFCGVAQSALKPAKPNV